MSDKPFWWPTERGWVTIALFALAAGLIVMGWFQPALWEVEVYKVITQAVVLTGLLNMIVAFHFTANKDERDAAVTRAENTAKAFDAIAAAQRAASPAVTIEPPATITETRTTTVEAEPAKVTPEQTPWAE